MARPGLIHTSVRGTLPGEPDRVRESHLPLTEVRGLQLAQDDKAAASGLMTEARQDRNPAACAPSGAWVRNRGVNPSVDAKHFTLATFPASNPQCSVFKVLSNRSLCSKAECLSTPTMYHSREETALTPCLQAGATAPEKR